MPRTPKPFYWRGGWYTDFRGERTHLASGKENKSAAEDELLRLRHKALEQDGKVHPDITVLQLIDLFLDSVKVEKSEYTYADYSRWLHEFAKQHGQRRVRSVTRLMAQQFKNEWAKKEYKKGKVYQPKTINHALIGLRRCWNWGIDAGLIQPANPFGKVPMLHAEGRQRLVKPEEFRALLRNAGDIHFLHVLLALRYTPARPGDIRTLTYPMIDWERHVWVIPKHKTTRTMKKPMPRIIPMPPVIEQMLRYRLQRFGKTDRVFTNSDLHPWKRDGFALRMRRVRDRAGIKADENGENLVMYTNRHTLLTQAARNGANGPQLQLLGGWTSLQMADRYVHLAETDTYEAGLKAIQGLQPQRSAK